MYVLFRFVFLVPPTPLRQKKSRIMLTTHSLTHQIPPVLTGTS